MDNLSKVNFFPPLTSPQILQFCITQPFFAQNTHQACCTSEFYHSLWLIFFDKSEFCSSGVYAFVCRRLEDHCWMATEFDDDDGDGEFGGFEVLAYCL